jgi:hypothetical protein
MVCSLLSLAAKIIQFCVFSSYLSNNPSDASCLHYEQYRYSNYILCFMSAASAENFKSLVSLLSDLPKNFCC